MSEYMVYVLRDMADEVIYVGATVRGERRIEEHRRHKEWFSDVATIERERFDTPDKASSRERELIALHRPRYVTHHTAYGHVPVPIYSPAFAQQMTLKEMAERLGYKNSDGLRSQVRFGALHAAKVGRDWVVSEAEFERYKRDHAGKPGRKPKKADP